MKYNHVEFFASFGNVLNAFGFDDLVELGLNLPAAETHDQVQGRALDAQLKLVLIGLRRGRGVKGRGGWLGCQWGIVVALWCLGVMRGGA